MLVFLRKIESKGKGILYEESATTLLILALVTITACGNNEGEQIDNDTNQTEVVSSENEANEEEKELDDFE